MSEVRRCNKGAMVATGAVFGILSCTQSAIAASLSYTVTEVGNFPPFLNISSATDINEAGQVIGVPVTSRPESSFFWDNGEQQIIDPLTIPEPINRLARFSAASAINDAGQVVGGSIYDSAIGFGFLSAQAFLWDENNGIQYLGALDFSEPFPGAILSESFAYDINNQIQIVGSSRVSVPTGPSTRAFLWENGVMQNLGIIGEARAINDLGQIVGTTTVDGLLLRRAFFWDNGNVQDLGLGSARDINESSQVVGNYSCGGVFEGCSFLWENGVRQDLGMFTASKINNQGQIVGSRDERAFLWENGMFADLNTLIDPDLGWLLTGASSINEKGQIVGSGINPDGARRAFLLTPQSVPEPNLIAGLGIIAAGLVLNLSNRRKFESEEKTS